jgi:transcriptional regulator with XRE-family HTH domain
MPDQAKAFRGDRLRQVRETKGLSQDDVARRLGFSDTQMNKYERGKNSPSVENIIQLAELLEVSADYLLGLTDDPNTFYEVDLTPEEVALITEVRRQSAVNSMRILTDLLAKNG